MARYALISAALRHLRDAEHLLLPGPHRSVEQALHLAGFGPECARKGCVDEDLADQALGHDIEDAEDSVVDFLLAMDPAASRYGIDEHRSRLSSWARHWRPACRYMATDAPEPLATVVADVLSEARGFVDDCVLDLWSDGLLPAKALSVPGA
jgi:hypothetical protein